MASSKKSMGNDPTGSFRFSIAREGPETHAAPGPSPFFPWPRKTHPNPLSHRELRERRPLVSFTGERWEGPGILPLPWGAVPSGRHPCVLQALPSGLGTSCGPVSWTGFFYLCWFSHVRCGKSSKEAGGCRLCWFSPVWYGKSSKKSWWLQIVLDFLRMAWEGEQKRRWLRIVSTSPRMARKIQPGSPSRRPSGDWPLRWA